MRAGEPESGEDSTPTQSCTRTRLTIRPGDSAGRTTLSTTVLSSQVAAELLAGRAGAKRTDATSTSAAPTKMGAQANPQVSKNHWRTLKRWTDTVKKVVQLALSVTLN